MTTTPPLAEVRSTEPPLPPEPLVALPSVADPSVPRHFDFVDSLRGLAIVAVMMVHVMFWIPNFHGRVRGFVAQTQFGVQLFFVVSAFTLFWSLRSRRSHERRPLLAFYARRLFRIGPLFWIAAAFYLTWPSPTREGSAPNGVHWPHVVTTLLFVHGWWPSTINTVVPGGWSIAAEAMFYLCIPLLFARVRTLNAALWVTVVTTWLAGAGAPVAVRKLTHHFPASWAQLVEDFVERSFPSQLPVFCLGIVLYFLLAEPDVSPGEPRRRPRVGGPVLVLTAALLVFGAMEKNVLPAVGFVALAVGLARRPLAVLVNPVTRFVGMVSFSGYIWHFWVLQHVGGPTVKLLSTRHHLRPELAYCGLLGVTLAGTLVIATASYYAIEVPGQLLGKWIINRMGWGRIVRGGAVVAD